MAAFQPPEAILKYGIVAGLQLLSVPMVLQEGIARIQHVEAIISSMRNPLAPPPLAGILEHVPYAWETWVILIAPLILTTRLIGAEQLFNQSLDGLFWTLQIVYFYILAATLTLIWTKLMHKFR